MMWPKLRWHVNVQVWNILSQPHLQCGYKVICMQMRRLFQCSEVAFSFY